MNKCAILALALLAAVAAVGAQQISGGSCPPKRSMTNFNWNSFRGKWYTISKLTHAYDISHKCIHDIYFNVPGPNPVLELGRTDIVSNKRDFVNGTMTIYNATKGEYLVKFPDSTLGQSLLIEVLGTDYGNWALLYGCFDFMFQKIEFAWVKVRTQVYWPATPDPAYNLYTSLGFDRSKLMLSVHDTILCGFY